MSPGVLVLSWYPLGLADDNGEPAEDLVSSVLDAAYRHGLKVRSNMDPKETSKFVLFVIFYCT